MLKMGQNSLNELLRIHQAMGWLIDSLAKIASPNLIVSLTKNYLIIKCRVKSPVILTYACTGVYSGTYNLIGALQWYISIVPGLKPGQNH